MIWLAIGAGGALGAMARHGVNHLVHQRALSATFPFGILVVNVAGSFAIGIIAGLLAHNRLELSYTARTFVIVGFLGGFTTFSSFSLDTLALVRDGHLGQAIWNVAGQVGLSLLGVWSGWWLATK
ncbi:MAG: fluoride efflux transporter CrcB [Vicinamibacterales bacterium]